MDNGKTVTAESIPKRLYMALIPKLAMTKPEMPVNPI